MYWDDNLAHTYILQYNENRQLSGAVFTEFDGYTANFSFSYDKDGRLLVADRDDYWLYFGNDEYVYNNSGQLISHKHYWGGGSIPYYQLDYEYDEQGILIGETHLDFNYGDDALEISSVYSYSYIFDSHGRVIEKQQHIAWTDSDGDGITKYGRYRSSEYVTVTRYLYDSLGRVQTVYSAYIPKSLCNPQGNPDLEWDDQTYYNYDYAPLVLVQSANGDSSVQIQDSAGKIIWSQSLGDNTLNTDAEGYILGSTDTYNAYRYELFYGDEIYDDQNVT